MWLAKRISKIFPLCINFIPQFRLIWLTFAVFGRLVQFCLLTLTLIPARIDRRENLKDRNKFANASKLECHLLEVNAEPYVRYLKITTLIPAKIEERL